MIVFAAQCSMTCFSVKCVRAPPMFLKVLLQPSLKQGNVPLRLFLSSADASVIESVVLSEPSSPCTGWEGGGWVKLDDSDDSSSLAPWCH